jgi:hypothetical protein
MFQKGEQIQAVDSKLTKIDDQLANLYQFCGFSAKTSLQDVNKRSKKQANGDSLEIIDLLGSSASHEPRGPGGSDSDSDKVSNK